MAQFIVMDVKFLNLPVKHHLIYQQTVWKQFKVKVLRLAETSQKMQLLNFTNAIKTLITNSKFLFSGRKPAVDVKTWEECLKFHTQTHPS